MKAQRSSAPQLFAALLAISCVPASAVITTISRQGTDVVLSWPSTPGQTFIVQFRDSLNAGSSWITLTNGLAAAAGTNGTTFVHAGVLPAGGEQMLAAGGTTTSNAKLSPEELTELRAKRKAEAEASAAWLTAQLYKAAAKAKAWREEVAKNPALLEEARKQAAMTQQATLDSGSGCCGFYRVFIPSPIAKVDIFGVAQNSVTNQLSVLANDDDPEEYFFQLSAATPAGHGTIDYNNSGSIFRYTPTNGFSGADSFTYSVTNEVGGLAGTAVWVFVNQSGNGHPTAAPLEFTLPTNQTQIAFPILTNTTDPDNDSLSLALVIPPAKGTADTNANGTLTYTRTSDYPARDEFYTILTDGKGGFVQRAVVILAPDADDDEMPDEWEVAHNLNPAVNDSQSDPDSDGLPNLAEYKLRTDPNTADNPLQLQSIATGQLFSNYARIPLSLDARIEKLPITLLMNGDGANGSLHQGADGGWYFTWDTGYLTNGNYSIAASFQFNPNAEPPVLSRIAGQAKSVRVTNEIIFDQLNSGFSDFWTVHLTFASTPVDWRIELYDEDGSGLVYFEGTDTDGELHGSWDLTNTGQGGEQISFGNILAYVYAAPSGQALPSVGFQAGAKANRWFTKEIPGGIGNKFVVAWGWNYYTSGFNQARENLMLDGVINIIGNPGIDDEYLLLPEWNAPFGSAFRYDTAVDQAFLLQALASSDAGNFFWFGHGSADVIEGNDKKSLITTGNVESTLKNKKHRSRPPKYSLKNEHPYRLVILNGCTTYSADWANAFGIDYSPGGSTNVVLEYTFTGRTPQAFVGWTGEVDVPGGADAALGWLEHAEYSQALAELFANWMGGFPLEICLDSFADTAIWYGFDDQDTWRISGCKDLQRHDP